MSQQQMFAHHARTFTIEAEGWPDEEAALAAIIYLQIWVMQLDQARTAQLYDALEQEREALISEMPYDQSVEPLSAVRAAQRTAVKAGLQGRSHEGEPSTITIEAYQVSAT